MTLLQTPLLVLGAPILGIVAALGLLAYGAYKLWQTLKSISWDGLVSEFKKLWSVFSQSTVGKVVVTLFESLWTLFKISPLGLLIQGFQTLFTVMTSGITSVINSVKGMLGISVSAEDKVKALDGKKGSYNVYQNNPYGSNIVNFSPKSMGPSNAVGKPQASNTTANTTIQVASNIHLDGRQIARVVTDHQVKMATTSPNYSQGFDPNMSPTPMVLKGNIA